MRKIKLLIFFTIAFQGCFFEENPGTDNNISVPDTDVIDQWTVNETDTESEKETGVETESPLCSGEKGCFWDRKKSVWADYVSYSDILISPDGKYLVLEGLHNNKLCFSLLDLETFEKHVFDEICNLRYISFTQDSKYVILLHSTGRKILEFSIDAMKVVEENNFTKEYSVIDISPDGRYIALSNTPNDEWAESQYEFNTYNLQLRELGFLDRKDNSITETVFPYAIHDLDFSPHDGFLMVTMSWWKETGIPEAVVQFFNPETESVTNTINFKNCASEMILNKACPYALLSPNRCFTHKVVLEEEIPINNEWNDADDDGIDDDEEWNNNQWNNNGNKADPISIIELETQKFLGNIPGFGPVALTKDGKTGIGFTRKETMMMEWNYFQTQNAGLIVVDFTNKFLWDVVEISEFEPVYFLSPDDKSLYFYLADAPDKKLKRMDLLNREVHDIKGTQANPVHHVWTPDSKALFVLDKKILYKISHPYDETNKSNIDLSPDLIRIRPQGDYLILGYSDKPVVHVVNVQTESVVKTIDF